MKTFYSSRILFHLLVGLFLCSLCVRSIEIGEQNIEVTVDSSYVSRYLWQGIDFLDNNGAWQPSIELSWKSFYTGIWGSFAAESGFVDSDELDYYIGYWHGFFDGTPYALNTTLTYTYIDFPKSDSDAGTDFISDGQEFAFGLSMSNLLSIGASSLGPYSTIFYEWDGVQNHNDVDNGWIFTGGISADIELPTLLNAWKDPVINSSWDITYNDGTYGFEADWSHSTLKLATTLEWKHFSFTPAIYYQWSLEDSVNNNDEFYSSISLNYKF